MKIYLQSKDFQDMAPIPKAFSCEGENISPQLQWDLPSDKVKSLALILDDPDSSSGTCTHWIIYDISPSITSLSQNISAKQLASLGITPGLNDFGNDYYQGPCPRPGKAHHYRFTLYLLNEVLDIKESIDSKSLMEIIGNKIISEAELIGLFSRD